jgi:hypothetical protein
MFGKHFLIFNILILVLSITPVSAVEISEVNTNSTMQDVNQSLILEINSQEKELKSFTDELNNHNAVIHDSLSYIKSNWWKFWKWGTVFDTIDKINSETQKISDTASKLNEIAIKLQKNSEVLEENIKRDNNSQSPKDLKDADHMVNNISQRLNLNMRACNATNLTEGDIVQYKSQGKYYRYLKYVKTENNNVILEGSKNKHIIVSKEEFETRTNLKFITNCTNNSKIINEAYKIQKAEIQKQIDDTEFNQKLYQDLTIAGAVVGGLGSVLIVVGLTLFGMAIALIVFTAATSATGIAAGIKITIVGCALLLTGGSLLIVSAALLCETNKKLNNLNPILNDLELYNDGLNYPPVAENMNFTTNGTSFNKTLNATDIDDDTLNFTIINQPTHGTLQFESNGNFSYTAGNDSNGTDSFTYMANDGKLNSNIATVTLNTHIPPFANNMNVTTRLGHNTSSIFNVTDNYGMKLNYTVLSNPEHGILNYTSDGNFTYIPNSNYYGNDNFTYTVNDGIFNSNTATVNIVVTSDNPPVANNMIVNTKKGKTVSKLLNITDKDGDDLTIILVEPPIHGKVTLTKDGKFIYIPNSNFVGTDFFTYLANDGFINSNTAKVFIRINS